MSRTATTTRDGLRLPGGLLLLLAGLVPAAARDRETPASAEPPLAAAAPGPLNLAEYARLTLSHQPALAARRAQLAAAEAHARSVAESKMPTLLVPDLPIRRQQAPLIVDAIRATVCQAECNTIHDANRAYLTYLYFRSQKAIHDEAVSRLAAREEQIHRLRAETNRDDVLPRHLDKVAHHLRQARARQAEAERGLQQARTAVGDMLGKGQNAGPELADAELPCPVVVVQREEILALAQTQRGEMMQATRLAELTALEIEAQGAIRRLTGKTFAAHLDQRSQPVPNGDPREQRVGAVLIPELPPSLAGSRNARIERATAAHLRSEAVVEKTRAQMVAEAEAAFLKWQEESRKLAHFRRAAEQAQSALAAADRDFSDRKPSVTLDEILANQVLVIQMRTQAAEALYHYDLSLAALQQVTGCGFRPSFEPAILGEVRPVSQTDE